MATTNIAAHANPRKNAVRPSVRANTKAVEPDNVLEEFLEVHQAIQGHPCKVAAFGVKQNIHNNRWQVALRSTIEGSSD